jgi:hypothetical protein
MARSRTGKASMDYYLPAHRLIGTQAEVLAQIDELILSLTGLRQLVSLHGPNPADVPKRELRLVQRFMKAALILGVLLSTLPATAQTVGGAPAQVAASAAPEQADASAPAREQGAW